MITGNIMESYHHWLKWDTLQQTGNSIGFPADFSIAISYVSLLGKVIDEF